MELVLEALSPSHVSSVVAACADWQTLAPFGPPYWRPRSSAELERKIATASGPQPASEYTFILREDDRMVGESIVHAIDWRNRVAEIGICIWRVQDRRQGIGTAGLSATVDWAQNYLGLQRLEAWINTGNEASLHMVKQLGFQYEGTLRRRYLAGGHYHDVQVHALLMGD